MSPRHHHDPSHRCCRSSHPCCYFRATSVSLGNSSSGGGVVLENNDGAPRRAALVRICGFWRALRGKALSRPPGGGCGSRWTARAGRPGPAGCAGACRRTAEPPCCCPTLFWMAGTGALVTLMQPVTSSRWSCGGQALPLTSVL